MSSSINAFSGIRTTQPGVVNSQVLPYSPPSHLNPCNIGSVSAGITSYQLMSGALIANPAPTSATPGNYPVVFTMPTAAQMLAAYDRVKVGDVFRVGVLNTGGTGLSINASGVTGVTGAFTANSGTNVNGLAGAESFLHLNWLQVSADGTTGAYQIF